MIVREIRLHELESGKWAYIIQHTMKSNMPKHDIIVTNRQQATIIGWVYSVDCILNFLLQQVKFICTLLGTVGDVVVVVEYK